MCGNAAGQLMMGERWLRATKDSEYWGYPLGLNYGLGRNTTTVISLREHYRRREKTQPVSTPRGVGTDSGYRSVEIEFPKGRTTVSNSPKGALL